MEDEIVVLRLHKTVVGTAAACQTERQRRLISLGLDFFFLHNLIF